MVCFAQNMIGKQRKNDGADLIALNPLYAGALEITEFLGQRKRVSAAHCTLVCRGRGLQ